MTHKYVLAAIKKKDVDKFFQLIDLPGYDVNTSAKGDTPLILAAKSGLCVVTEKLISKGADLNMRDGDGRTALLHGCLSGNSEVVRQLLYAGSDTNNYTVNGDFALHESITSGDMDTVQTLLELGTDVNKSNCISGYTPLMLALLNGFGDIVRLLLRYEANLNQAIMEGDTALHLAVQVAPPDVIADLIHAGCNMDILNNMGETPLIVSVYEGRIDAARLLILSGCSIDRYDYFSPLCVACVQNSAIMVRYLLSEGYNVSKDNSVKQNLFFKFEDNYPELFSYIFEDRCVKPMSLREISRVRVRQLLGPDVSGRISQLSLPGILKDWVVQDVIY
ncbi:putative ankyrin repeat protein RF_0381 [Haliotis rufescens]|uniref:putative ankyrin repeat protein RF_0381 n=1 Tax=Haliotis rufescens TaxID=6454 RepID=UPI001EB04A78|nr:putative ankyrin repeat protein RF_0381 [Haliotis rufescens]